MSYVIDAIYLMLFLYILIYIRGSVGKIIEELYAFGVRVRNIEKKLDIEVHPSRWTKLDKMIRKEEE